MSSIPASGKAFRQIIAYARSCFLSRQEHHTVLEISVNMLDLKITGVLLGPLGIP